MNNQSRYSIAQYSHQFFRYFQSLSLANRHLSVATKKRRHAGVLSNAALVRQSLLAKLAAFAFSLIAVNAMLAGAAVAADHTNEYDRLSAIASNPNRALNPEDYTLSIDNECNYIIASTAKRIKKIIYFDASGNNMKITRDNYGNRFGKEINLSETALAGVIESGGTIFIKAKTDGGRRFNRTGVAKITEIPDCSANQSACPMEFSNDPLFQQHATANANGSAGYTVTLTAGSGGSLLRCRSVLNVDGVLVDGVLINVDFSADEFGAGQFFRNGASEGLIPLNNAESMACAIELGCPQEQLVPASQ